MQSDRESLGSGEGLAGGSREVRGWGVGGGALKGSLGQGG